MDNYLFISLIVVIVLLLAARIYFFRYKSKKNRMSNGRTGASPVSGQKDENDDDAKRIADVTARFEENRSKTVAASAESGEVLAEIAHVNKSYGGKPVVQDVSFAVQKGEILGLVGPNGAGKTTTIRMLMDIIKPDSGEISIFGRKLDENAKNRIGYLPEERGLYRKMKVSDSLVYLASLKNVPSGVARDRSEALLKQVDMYAHRSKKVNELSRGMGQIIQFLVTIAHNPDLIVLDEPFSGLDPVNRMLLKNIILELKAQGKSVILSTHMMNEVEEMCDRIIMIDKGRVVLYGDLADFTRDTHFEYVPLPGGDRGIEEPWRMAVSWLYKVYGEGFTNMHLPVLRQSAPEDVNMLTGMIDRRINSPLTSGAGRFFDAVASILGLCQVAAFPAQGPMLLEALTRQGCNETYKWSAVIENKPGINPASSSAGPANLPGVIQLDETLKGIVEDIGLGAENSIIASKFHNTITSIIFETVNAIRRREGLNKVVLSGGVFQNKYLLERTESLLSKNDFEVFFHAAVPTNDGGIALGQLAVAAKRRELKCV